MTDLWLKVESVSDMDLDRAAAVGHAYDEDPELRPLRVGGDPARIRVGGSLEELIRRTGLPVDWLTVRTNSRRDGFEAGEIVLRPGRGGFVSAGPPGTDKWLLSPNTVNAGFLRSWTDAEPDRLDRVAALFARLCEAMDACYGIAGGLFRLPPVDMGLGGVGWLNFFGPAFLERWPQLGETSAPTTRLANGGVVIRVAPTPWQVGAPAKQPVIDAVGAEAFVPLGAGPLYERGVHAPSYADHMRFSPGTDEMPWVAWLRDRSEAKAERLRALRYTKARRERDAALAGRPDPGAPLRAAEWSTSFDADDWRSFGRRLFKRLGGEFAGAVAKPLIEEIASAPHDLEESIVITADIGPIEVGWFIDDIETVDIYLFGPAELPALVDAEHERWAG